MREFELPVFGGDVLVLLLGLWRELCDALEDVLEKCREVSGTDRCAGEVRKSEPGEVDNDGPSDLEHSDTYDQKNRYVPDYGESFLGKIFPCLIVYIIGIKITENLFLY